MAVLLIVTGSQIGTRYEFDEDILIGRASDCKVRIQDGRMSRRHARIVFLEDGGIAVDDLGSRNGTFHNGTRIDGLSRIAPGDYLRVGETVLVFEPSLDLLHSRHTGGVVIVSRKNADGLVQVEMSRAAANEGGIDGAMEADAGVMGARLAARLSPRVDMAGLLTSGLAEVASFFEADKGVLLLVDDGQRRVSPAAVAGTEEMVVELSLIERVLDSGVSLVQENPPLEIRLGPQQIGSSGASVLMSAPIIGPSKPLGMIVLERRRDSNVDAPWERRALAAARAAGAILGMELLRIKAAERLEAERAFLVRGGTPGEALVVGDGPSLRRLLDDARRAARGRRCVLLSGELGSGRALIARYIHEHSPRAEGPLRLLQCGRAFEMDIEALLFGEEKGPGGLYGRTGVVETAHGGTLYLEDVDWLPDVLLANLRAIHRTGMLVRMGGTRQVPVDVRFVGSTRSEGGKVRARDLLGSGSVSVKVPPLRQRSEDVSLLFSYFAEMAASALGKNSPIVLSAQARRAAEAHQWPGNVRELKNLVERLTLLEEPGSIIEAAQLPGRGILEGIAEGDKTLAEKIAALEAAAITQALEEEGKKIGAAHRLGISRPTLDRKLKIYGISVPKRMDTKS